METTPRSATRNKKSPRTFFTIAFGLWLAMAFSWAVDGSLVLIFFGAALFFFFLGFYYLPRKATDSRRSSDRIFRPGAARSESRESLSARLKRAVPPLERPPTGVSSDRVKQVLRRFTGVTIFLFLLAMVMVTLLGGGDDAAAQQDRDAGEQFFLMQQYDSAVVYYRRALTLDGDDPQALVGYGKTLWALDKVDSALLLFDRALNEDPDYAEAAYSKALVYYNQKKYTEGVAALEALLDNQPDHYDAMLLMGDIYYTQERYQDAIGWYEGAYGDGGQRSRILCHIMAYIYDQNGEFDKAIAFYREALLYDSTVVDIYRRLGELVPGRDGDYYRQQALQMN